MEPDGDEADDVDDGSPDEAEGFLKEERASSRRNHPFSAGDFGELHLGPELDEMDYEESQDDDAENEHVLRRPLDSLRLAHHGITVGTACTTVLHGEHDRIEDVDEDEHCQDGRCCKSIPVGAEELADRVVGYRPDNGY